MTMTAGKLYGNAQNETTFSPSSGFCRRPVVRITDQRQGRQQTRLPFVSKLCEVHTQEHHCQSSLAFF